MVGYAGPYKSQVTTGVGLGFNLLAGSNSIADRSAGRVPEHFPNLSNEVAVFPHAGEDFHPISQLDALSLNFNPQHRSDTDAQVTVMYEDKRSQHTITSPNPLAGYHTASHGNIIRMNPIVAVFRPPGIVSIPWIRFHDLTLLRYLKWIGTQPFTPESRQSLYRVRYQVSHRPDHQTPQSARPMRGRIVIGR